MKVWLADVGFISGPRYDGIGDRSWLSGAPDIVVEVLSPSNTVAEMDERREICLQNGSLQFWVVNTDRKTVSVSTPDGTSRTYRLGDEIDLALFGGGKLPVIEVFGDK